MTWTELLDALDAELSDGGTGGAWHPPAGIGPLPADLEDRARSLVRAQTERAASVRAELDALRRHLDALDRIPPSRPDAAVYLDLDG